MIANLQLKSGQSDCFSCAMVVAQLVERSLPTLEVRCSNPDIGKKLSTNCTINSRKDENKEKEAVNCLY